MQVVGSDSPEVQLRFIAIKPGKGETKVSTELTQQGGAWMGASHSSFKCWEHGADM